MPIPPKRKGRLDWLPFRLRSLVFEWKSLARVERSYFVGALRFVERRLRPQATILFYPEVPRVGSVAFFLSSALGYRMTNDLRMPVDGAMRYHDATFSDERIPSEVFVALRPVNAECCDIRKDHVQEVFDRVFGYSISVDPLTHVGPMVEKSNLNATKDAKVIEGPLAADQVRPGYVYQHRVDARVGDGWIEEMRIPVYGGAIPPISMRRRPEDAPFISRSSHTDVVEADQVLSPEEIDRVLQFARELKMDFGDLDAMRDAQDGRLYILDANNTPNGPTSRISDDVYSWSVLKMAAAFEASLLPPERRSRHRALLD